MGTPKMLVNDAQFARHASQDHVRPLSIGRAPVRLVLGAWDGPQQTVQSALARASFFFFFFIGQTGLDQILGFRTLPKAAEGREKSAPGADSHTRPASQWTPGVETNPGDGSISVRPASRDSRHGNRSLTSPSEFSFALRRESRLQAGWRALHGSAVFFFSRPPQPLLLWHVPLLREARCSPLAHRGRAGQGCHPLCDGRGRIRQAAGERWCRTRNAHPDSGVQVLRTDHRQSDVVVQVAPMGDRADVQVQFQKRCHHQRAARGVAEPSRGAKTLSSS